MVDMLKTTINPPIPIGSTVKPLGKVSGVAYLGERCYFMVDKKGTVSMMPSDVVEGSPHSTKRPHQITWWSGMREKEGLIHSTSNKLKDCAVYD